MLTDFICPGCQKDLREAGETSYVLEPRTGLVEHVRISTTVPATWVRCANGHTALFVVGDGGYSLLFQRALQRLATGSPRDAVIDAHTALEMFLSHAAMRVIYDRTPNAKLSEIRKSLEKAQVFGSFERIFGAAIASAALVSEKPPVFVDFKKTRNVRNEAVHNGEEPTEAKAETLCLEVERVILELTAQLDAQPCVNASPYFEADFVERITAFRAAHRETEKNSCGVVHATLATVFAMNHTTTPRRGVKEFLADYREAHAEGDDSAWAVW